MPVHIKPCHGCPVGKGCAQRKEFATRVAGLGLRSATFNCDILDAKLAPGTRIIIAIPMIGTNEYGDHDVFAGRHEVSATIVSSKGGQFACVIDPKHAEFMTDNSSDLRNPERIRFRKSQAHRRIVRFLDEPKREMCGIGRVKLPGGSCDRPEGEPCDCAQYDGKSWVNPRMETS
jgi:hypothetical protein